ncbi:MAG TPA: (d)CMP kinase [Bacteroidales bacterium]|nr:MAG: cytidylate kinase [Bacteroidetes bacterium GWF2_33_38]OFY74570.1 MAG: cytidylate kinase [Bacteroidetes bacterium RIFOXYA12_FULL_33_9]OFY89363.1 MAG: cytidylate kinase [Bacteroidetes bacterium RIFOXYA2_FULL_33_7]HBF88089.1 (d)CMP kinase [Bacteroidales bacterium]
MKKIVIAVDGYSSCGKSTLAKEIAKELKYAYIDSGAMYRAVTYFCIKNQIIIDSNINFDKLQSELKNIKITFNYNPQSKKNETYLNGENIEEQIRNIEVANNVSLISTIKFVREHLVNLQQEMGAKKGIVMDGRDIGTVVFPNAEVKLFMTAEPSVRAKRRYEELIAKGQQVSLEEIIANVESRDYMDTHRDESPLRKADDAITINNSNLSKNEQYVLALKIINEKIQKLNESRN